MRRNVDPELLQVVGVQLSWETVVITRPRDDFHFDPLYIFSQLLFEYRECFLVSFKLTLFKQLPNAVNKALAVANVLLHFTFVGAQQARIKPLAGPILGKLSQRCVAVFQSDIANQSGDSGLLAFRRNLWIDQGAEPPEHCLRHIKIGQHIFLLQLGTVIPVLCASNQDFQVLQHSGVSGSLTPLFEFRKDLESHGLASLIDPGF